MNTIFVISKPYRIVGDQIVFDVSDNVNFEIPYEIIAPLKSLSMWALWYHQIFICHCPLEDAKFHL